jgi:hypothetical protein
LEETIRYVATLVTLSFWFSIAGFVAMGVMVARVVWLTRGIHANTEALLEGQRHIAELAAEVLRRQRP